MLMTWLVARRLRRVWGLLRAIGQDRPIPRSPSVRTVIKLGPPDPSAAGDAIARMTPEGDTPIGDAMIAAKRDLDATGLSKRHILVITDGENNKGYSPANVMQVMGL